MLGLMRDWPLLCHRIIKHAAAIHGNKEVVTRSVEGPIVRTTYKQVHEFNHAQDRIVIVDLTFVPVVEQIAGQAWKRRAVRGADRRGAYAGDEA